MKEVTAYLTSDDKLWFEQDENKALQHQSDLVGLALDSLIPTSCDYKRHKLLLEILAQPNLKELVFDLNKHLQATDIRELNYSAKEQLSGASIITV